MGWSFPKTVKVIAFDLDGTLLDNLDLILKSWKMALARFNIDKTDGEILKLFGRSTIAISELLVKGNNGVSAEELRNLKDTIYEELWPKYAKLMPEAKNVLKFLKEKAFILTLVSSNRAERLWRKLKFFGIEKFFTAVVGYDEVARGKPHPDMLLKLAEKVNRKPEEIVYIGDTAYDVEAAKRMGAYAILIPSKWQTNLTSDFKPDFILKSLKEIKKLFLQ